jgi:PadR family transcriptional regulator, regulatory protein AphA
MSLPHVLLGLLAESPSTGYDLARALESEIEPAWRAEFSQIYPALARLRRAGFVLLRVLGPRHGPRRNLYRVTAAGRRELKRWLDGPLPAPRGKDEGLARLAFFDLLDPGERRLALARYERVLSEETRRLRQLPRPPGFRGQARLVVLERLEASRRAVAVLAREEAAPPLPRAVAGKKK